MLDDFLFNVNYGINHVLDINAYDHVLFLTALALPFVFNDWKRLLLFVTMFTLGHTISLVLASYDIVSVNADLVEFLIPVTILIMALFHVFTAGKGAQKEKIGLLFISTLFFGLVHGFGFAREFKILLSTDDDKLVTLFEFALGIEISQVIIVFLVLFLGFLGQTIFRFTRRDWIMVMAAIVVGLTIPMVLNSALLS